MSLPRHAGRRSLLAAPLGGGVYLLARELDLMLLGQVLEALFVVILVALVVVYQGDVRRLLERAFSGRRRTDAQPTADVAEVVADAAAALAARRIGALIALRGREPWMTHQQGGVELGGTVSVPLLCSVFDPHTPGHDGALLIDGDRAVRFAVHLPLSTEPPEVSRFGGTRHAAALGLAQACDALVVVISEETGSISVAEDGLIEILADSAALRARLHAFRRRLAGSPMHAIHRGGLTNAAQTALASIALTGLLWLALVYSPDTILRSYDLPIAIRNLPDDWMVRDPLPTSVRVDIAGAEQRLRDLDPASLTIALDLSDPAAGTRPITLGADELALPPGVEVRRIQPDVLSVDLVQTQVVSVPVVVPMIGTLPDGLTLVSARPAPADAGVVVPVGEHPPARVLTQVLDLRTVTGTGPVPSRLVPPAGATLAASTSLDVVIDVEVRDTRETAAAGT